MFLRKIFFLHKYHNVWWEHSSAPFNKLKIWTNSVPHQYFSKIFHDEALEASKDENYNVFLTLISLRNPFSMNDSSFSPSAFHICIPIPLFSEISFFALFSNLNRSVLQAYKLIAHILEIKSKKLALFPQNNEPIETSFNWTIC